MKNVDFTGLEIDAQGREEYLMSSLCRLFPWSTAIIGSHPGGREALQQFLSSPIIFGDLDVRNDHFAEHLLRILSFRLIPKSMVDSVTSFVHVERGLAKNRGDLRTLIKKGGVFPHLPPTTQRSGVLYFSPYTVIAQLPFSSMLLQGIMGCSSDQVWRMIRGGGFVWDQIQALFRADTESCTFLCRALPKGYKGQRASFGAVAPSMEIEQRTIEMVGDAFLSISQLREKPLEHMPEQHKRYATQLIEREFAYFSENPVC